jgi:hypothetical protein
MEARSDVANRTKFPLWFRAGVAAPGDTLISELRESSRLRVSPLTANDPRNASGKLLAFATSARGRRGRLPEQAWGTR